MLSFNGMGAVEWMPEAGKNPRQAANILSAYLKITGNRVLKRASENW